MSMTILVAGATGGTGQHLVQYRIEQGHKPIARTNALRNQFAEQMKETIDTILVANYQLKDGFLAKDSQ